jgi:hypothetical protein
MGGMAVPRVVGRMAKRGGAALLAVAAAFALSACTGSGYHYVKDSTDDGSGTYFKVPEGWRIYDENQFFAKLDLGPERAKERKATSWAVAFDASRRPTLNHFEQPVTTQPFGVAEVRRLGADERDQFSLMAMRNLVLPVDDLLDSGAADVEVLRHDEFSRDGGFHGLRFTFNLRYPDSKRFVTFDQVSIVDSETKDVHLLVISCSAKCYEHKKDTINTVMDSWTVKER